jgi:glycosyltransferase involved in cell wall biosynthesis
MQGGGAERVAALLSNYWVERGYSVTLVSTYSGGGGCDYYLDERVKLEFLADLDKSTINISNSLPVRIFKIRRIVRKYRPDVVISFMTRINIGILLATFGLRIPVVVSERIYPPANPTGLIWRKLRKLTYPFAKYVVMQTHQGRKWLENEIPNANGVVIANPCVYPLPDKEPIIPPDDIISTDRKLILAVGRLTGQKGFISLIHAFYLLSKQDDNVDLAILGEGDERMLLENTRDGYGLEQRIILPGRVGNITDWYRRATIFVMPSKFEGFPNVLLEAMAYGLPVISSNCDTGPADIITDKVDGVLVDPESGIDGLANELADLLGDETKQKNISRAALSVRERFSIEKIGSLWEKVLWLSNE